MANGNDRPDLRQISVDIGQALKGYDREQLVAMLTFVFKEYVVEGPPSVLVSQVDELSALSGLSFAELIEQLQARLDVPELEQFAVRDGQVLIRVGGVLTPVVSAPSRAAPSAPPSESDLPRASATGSSSNTDSAKRTSVEEAMGRGRGDLLGGHPGIVQSTQAPTPRGRISINSRPAGGAVAPTQSGLPPNSSAANKDIKANQAANKTDTDNQPDKPPHGDDDASVRFSLLELD